MQRDHPLAATSVLTWMLCALLAGFIVQSVFGRWLGNSDFERLFALRVNGIRNGFLWTMLTYTLLHSGILHLLVNGLGLFLLGRELAPMLGSRRFLAFSAAAAVVGALAWLAIHFAAGGGAVLVGASAIVLGLFIVFACFHPDREITFLLFFVLPVTLRPRIAAWIILGLEVLGLLFGEIPGGRYDTGIAHSAHLGGMLVGWIYFRYFHANNGWDRPPTFGMEMGRWLRRRKPPSAGPAYRVDVTPKSKDLRAEVDRVLDKINSQGFGALTEEEKRILDEAKDMLSRR